MKHSWIIFTFLSASLLGQTIAEKKESLTQQTFSDEGGEESLSLVNETLWEKRLYLKGLYDRAEALHREGGAPESTYQALLHQIKKVKREIAEIEETWRQEASSFTQGESYALWNQPETSIQQLVMDYGAQEYIYLIPPEVGGMKLSVNSILPIPREAWSECLELILQQYGIGMRQLNPYLRELYLVDNDPSGIACITNNLQDLELLPAGARVCYVLSPDTPDPRATFQFLEKFSNEQTTTLQLVRHDIFIVAGAEAVRELLKLYEFIKAGHEQQEYQMVSLSKIEALEMHSILESAFCAHNSGDLPPSLRIMPVASSTQSLFLTGSKVDIKAALKLIREVEAQIENPQEKTVYWYTVKHSDPEDLAKVLAQVYDLLTQGKTSLNDEAPLPVVQASTPSENGNSLVVKTPLVEPLAGKSAHKTADGQNNFIVDSKTGSIIMVVEQEALPKIKQLLRKLDVPKKMVQIEVLLFEKKETSQNNFGLNLLRIGSAASQQHLTGLAWNFKPPGAGILDFFVSREKGSGIPAYDLAYNFLLGQENVQINASPSVTTVNQTPATIAIVEEISINTGVVEIDTTKGANLKDSFQRAQYGITIQITPTINMGEDEGTGDDINYITLDTDITFDTTKKSVSDRPDVTRRHIKNHVRIADGQTVILGGLRRKNSEDNKDSIPFLGEIPGIGKLFSTTRITDSTTEMFVFITPKIIADPLEDAERIKQEELCKRPGDVPLFLHQVMTAREREKKRLFEGTLTALFGHMDSSTSPISEYQGEYDGR